MIRGDVVGRDLVIAPVALGSSLGGTTRSGHEEQCPEAPERTDHRRMVSHRKRVRSATLPDRRYAAPRYIFSVSAAAFLSKGTSRSSARCEMLLKSWIRYSRKAWHSSIA